MKPQALLSKLALALGLILLSGLLWGGYSMFRGFRAATAGAEYPPAEEQRSLAAQLQERFRWSALPPASVEHVWTIGFRDHTSLFRIHLAPEIFAALRNAVLATQGEGITSDGRDDLRLCPFGFASSSPSGPAGLRLPAWWEASSLRHFDSILWQSSRWGCWLGYDTERQLLFLLTYNT